MLDSHSWSTRGIVATKGSIFHCKRNWYSSYIRWFYYE